MKASNHSEEIPSDYSESSKKCYWSLLVILVDLFSSISLIIEIKVNRLTRLKKIHSRKHMLCSYLVLLNCPVSTYVTIFYNQCFTKELPLKWFLSHNFVVCSFPIPNCYNTNVLTKFGSPRLLRSSPILLPTGRQTNGHSQFGSESFQKTAYVHFEILDEYLDNPAENLC